MPRKELTEAEIEAKVEASKDLAVVRLVNAAIKDAIVSRASGVRFKKGVSRSVLEFKVGDVWSERSAPPKESMDGVLTRLKILAALDFAGEGNPESGTFKLQVMGSAVIFSAYHSYDEDGEEIVLTISV